MKLRTSRSDVSKDQTSFCVSTFHTCIKPLMSPVATNFESALKVTQVTESLWPMKKTNISFKYFRNTYIFVAFVSSIGGGIESILKHLYLNDYAEFDSIISYIMFSYGYLLVCEISTIRTLALKEVSNLPGHSNAS